MYYSMGTNYRVSCIKSNKIVCLNDPDSFNDFEEDDDMFDFVCGSETYDDYDVHQ